MKIVVVMPSYNEEKVIARVVKEVKEKIPDVIAVDDGSTDQTGIVANEAGAKVLKHFLNRGQGAALQTGINFALAQGAEVIVTFDADGQHNPSDIDRVVKPLLLGEAQVVLGSRFLKSENGYQKTDISSIPLVKVIVLKFAAWFTRLYTGLKVTDAHNGFRALSRNAAELIEIRQDGMAHASEIIEQIKKHNLRFVEVPVQIVYSQYSLQKGQKLSNSFRILWDLIISRLTK